MQILNIVALVLNGPLSNFIYFSAYKCSFSLGSTGCISITKVSKITTEYKKKLKYTIWYLHVWFLDQNFVHICHFPISHLQVYKL
jgi:hypothetical protein